MMGILFADRDASEPLAAESVLRAGKKVPPDLITFLMDDHRVVLGWFEWYQQAPSAERRSFVAHAICLALRVHMMVEEELFYPSAAAALGDNTLIARALAEHQDGKDLIKKVEAADGGDAQPGLVATLKQAITQHIEEEELELFPKVRETDLDFYELGRSGAARRTELFFHYTASRPQPKETGMQAISTDEARKFFVIGLRNIHAAAGQGRTMVQAQVRRLENYPVLEAKLQDHLKEKDMQLQRVENILSNLGESHSSFKDASMSLMGAVSSASASMADDEILKNSFTMYGLCNFEAAAYETLLVMGEAAGEYGAVKVLQDSLSEERAMAAFMAQNMRGTGIRFLQLRTEGLQASH